jgi:hypothetical protein
VTQKLKSLQFAQ